MNNLSFFFKKNFFSLCYSQAITVIVQLVQIPLLINFWGLPKYGEWAVLTSISVLMSVLDFGLTNAFSSYLLIVIGNKNWDLANNIYRTMVIFSLFIGFVIFLTGILLSCFVNWSTFLNLIYINDKEACWIVILMSLWCAINLQWSFLDSKMKASGKTAQSAFIIGNRRLADSIFCLLSLVLGLNIVLTALAFVLSAVSGQVVHFIYARKWQHNLFSKQGVFLFSILKNVVSPGFAFFGINATQILLIQGSTQYLNYISTSSDVGAFTFARTLSRLIFQFGSVINNSLRPELSLLLNSSGIQYALSYTRKIMLFSFVFGFLAYISYGAFGSWFFSFFTKDLLFSRFELFVIGLPAFLGLLWFIPSTLMMASNKHSFLSFLYLISAVISFFISFYFLSFTNSIYSVCIMLIIPELVACMYILIQKTKA